MKGEGAGMVGKVLKLLCGITEKGSKGDSSPNINFAGCLKCRSKKVRVFEDGRLDWHAFMTSEGVYRCNGVMQERIITKRERKTNRKKGGCRVEFSNPN